ncbi:MAG: DUF2846 domain-containing protein [Acidobacteriia bacterium]|nr:DUF2846 domain-containing protein [Terriglobia bacterium]
MNRKWKGLGTLVTVFALLLTVAIQAGPCLAGEKDDDKEEGGGYVRFEDERPMGEVQPDKALVYVVRPAMVGFAIKSFFLCDDEILGINKGHSYFFSQVAPGKHVFWSKSENVDALELEVSAGKTYYIQQHVQMGGFRARTKLEVLGEAEGKTALDKCKKHAVMTAQGIEKGKEIARDHLKDTQEDLDRRARKDKKE